ncbi:SDR family NAD(P)-dependent oxidoreductase [Kineosporia babensis]|uniref:SDR family oxidoreductase n=1 Tax=Kineosporia babensis TaxID=499548 RepID=A0A9X1NB27_9ACTN|nr:SDR family NAD(P)-dependent oxidoreductase [Kineosporia babensis]MCD5310459.1 SDR family oxidoreductase [Kineosporia babensis]
MSRVIAILGAGTGLGAALARRFGQEGFRTALVGRRLDRLEALATELKAEGVEAATFGADLSEPANVPGLLAEIRERFGRIDVVHYGPASNNTAFTPAVELTPEALDKLLPLFLLTPIEVVRGVLPQMRERGEGAILLSQGLTAAVALPGMSGVGPAMAAARNFMHTLNLELQGTGVHAGMLTIGALIQRSETAEAGPLETGDGEPSFPVADPDELAGLYWDMYVRKDTAELFYPAAAG